VYIRGVYQLIGLEQEGRGWGAWNKKKLRTTKIKSHNKHTVKIV